MEITIKSNENESNIPSKCTKCGSELEERSGKYGKFLGCTNFPQCRYTYDLSGNTTNIKCPDCGKDLRFRNSKYGRFLSCSGYPDCKFAFNPEFKDQKVPFCPECGKTLEMLKTDNNKFLSCTGSPECNFKLEWVDDKEALGEKRFILTALIAVVN